MPVGGCYLHLRAALCRKRDRALTAFDKELLFPGPTTEANCTGPVATVLLMSLWAVEPQAREDQPGLHEADEGGSPCVPRQCPKA